MAVFIGATKGRKRKDGKIKISFIDSNGYKIYRYVTREELRLISRIIDVTIE